MEESVFLVPLKEQVGDLSGGAITWESILEFHIGTVRLP